MRRLPQCGTLVGLYYCYSVLSGCSGCILSTPTLVTPKTPQERQQSSEAQGSHFQREEGQRQRCPYRTPCLRRILNAACLHSRTSLHRASVHESRPPAPFTACSADRQSVLSLAVQNMALLMQVPRLTRGKQVPRCNRILDPKCRTHTSPSLTPCLGHHQT